MDRIRRNLQVVVVAVGLVLLVVALLSLALGQVSFAVGVMALLLWLVLAVVAHVHLRSGDTWRKLVRLEKSFERAQTRHAAPAFDPAAVEPVVRRAVVDELAAAREEQQRTSRVITDGMVTRVDLMDRRMGAVGRELVSAAGRLEARARLVAETHEAAETDWVSSVEGLTGRFDALDGALTDLSGEVSRLHHEPISEIDAMMQLHRRVPLDGPVPLMAGWALSPRGILQIVDLASTPQVKTVVECGSGTSTIFVGATLRDRPGARVVALEHLEEFAEKTQGMVDAHGLQEVVEVRFSPLVEVAVQGQIYQWYDLSAAADLVDVDILLVDGPPRATGHNARFPAVPMFVDRLADNAVVVLDDVVREEEAKVARRWEKHTPGLQRVRSSSSDQAVLAWSRPMAESSEDARASEHERSSDR